MGKEVDLQFFFSLMLHIKAPNWELLWQKDFLMFTKFSSYSPSLYVPLAILVDMENK